MKRQKVLSALLSLVFVICTLGFAPLTARAAGAGYLITGSEDNGGFVLHVYLQNAIALSGRLAIAFDSDKLELSDTSDLSSAVNQGDGVIVTPEGLDPSVLLSNEKGYAMFAWYSNSNSGIDAVSSDAEIAAIRFNLINGATTEDFSRNTIGLYYVNETMAHKWDCSAQIVTNELVSYTNNSVFDEYVCAIDYDYPNCDYVPPVTYEAGVYVTDTSGNPVRASVTLDNIPTETNADGYVSLPMENGVYAYRVSANGYKAESGYIIIRDGAATARVTLTSYAQIVQSTANTLAIGYADGDDASSVTSNIVLRTSGDYGEEITWQSSNDSVADSYGVVTRGENDVKVTLTATVALEGNTATRSFSITVKSRISAEEKNAALVAKDKAALEIQYAPGDSATSVTASLTLAEAGVNGSAIVWTSSNEDVITSYGAVTRPASDTKVTLTALIVRTGAQDTKEFTVTVKGETAQSTVSDADIVDKVLSSLAIVYSDGDSAESVTNNLTLASEGAEETVIEWTSSQPAVVTAYGGVVRQATDVSVTLTATAVKGSVSKSKTFTVLVKAAEQIPVNPDNGQEEEIADQNAANSGSDNTGNTGSTGTTDNTGSTGTTDSTDTTDSTGTTDGTGTTDSTGSTGTTNGTGSTGSSGGSGGSGSSSIGKPTSTSAPTDADGTTEAQFTDIDGVPWAREAILTLAGKGVIKGVSETEYAPQSNIRRADFVILLSRMLGLDGEITNTFDDVPADAYYYEEVSRALSLGVIAGVGDNKFAPESSITRQDIMVMTYNALKKLGMADFDAADLSDFKDDETVSDYAYESVSKMVGAGYISGDDNGNINPRNNTTRAETAVFLYRIDNAL